ncbi:hydroxyisourate hydrolase [Pseudomonas sp. EL_65y_Pfl1_R83]|nr:hydroxyisourate hydrolase [uncultured Bradyrhizobium sp.]
MSLSTHVLDTSAGIPAAGVTLKLARGDLTLFSGETDADGRCAGLRTLSIAAGVYSLRFSVAAYFRARGIALPDPPFLDVVTIDFGIAEADAHYHVPLLVSPFAYSTYRGS